ncbi:endoplasmic reticulum membrane sensor NFE2L1-like isoform X2 [Megalops cyprinoides]|uniref:endoplasmic reticulum membrane sensor NFE2L1-like isoform X2 n=1 Tax=Megalops cyprinoides TaxID=118141 RepID=UPI001863A50C|nr:endoplasmic reticulum membrane sensor NFE2L1-like isoform X2 [Megalops cyprinoides]
MLYLKKYFTEGLIQFTILLSLIGVQVDVDTYLSSQLPPLREIILGPSSAYTQTQFHNLRNTLDGYGIHPKSVDLDYFFASRRLLSQVRSLDRLRVPSTQLDAWLVHRDPEGAVSAAGQSGPSIALDNGGVLEDVGNPESSAMRGGGGVGGGVGVGVTHEAGFGPGGEDSLGAVAPQDEQEQVGGGDNLTKEDIDLIDILWRQDIDLGAGREVFDYSNRQKESEVDKHPTEEKGEELESEESWRNGLNLPGGQAHAQVDGETGENIPEQFPGTVNSDLNGSGEEGPSTSQGLLPSPLLPQSEPSLDLEQQWQDIMAIMELQDMEVNSTAGNSFLATDTDNSSTGNNHREMEAEPLVNYGLSSPTPINQDVSLHQASLPSCSQDLRPFFSPDLDGCVTMEPPGPHPPALLSLSSSNSSNLNTSFGATNLTGLFLPPPLNGTNNGTLEPVLPDPLNVLLEEAMLDEINILDLALEEGFSHTQASQLGEELDSDSGLSLDSGHSPASPSSSETSCSSASSSCSSTSFSEEGAIGYSTDAEAEEGAVGGYQPEHSKFCRMSYQDPSQFHCLPQLEHVGHNHTYNLPLSASRHPTEQPQPAGTRGKRPGRDRPQDAKLQQPFQEQNLLDKQSSRDERRARAMKIPFSNDKIINLPVEEFNELLAKHRLSEAQLALVRDIRRRGKNKMAAQNCRKRKLDTILNLEQGVDALRRDKARLLKEKMEFLRSIRQMKQKVHSLYQEVFSQLRDESGRPYPTSEYALQYGSDGSVLLTPRRPAAEQSRKPEKKQKDKKK